MTNPSEELASILNRINRINQVTKQIAILSFVTGCLATVTTLLWIKIIIGVSFL